MPRRLHSGSLTGQKYTLGLIVIPSTSEYTKLASMYFTLASSAVAGNRVARVALLNQEESYVHIASAPVAQVASQSGAYSASQLLTGGSPVQAVAGAAQQIGLPDFWLPPGWGVLIDINPYQSGDVINQAVGVFMTADDPYSGSTGQLMAELEGA